MRTAGPSGRGTRSSAGVIRPTGYRLRPAAGWLLGGAGRARPCGRLVSGHDWDRPRRPAGGRATGADGPCRPGRRGPVLLHPVGLPGGRGSVRSRLPGAPPDPPHHPDDRGSWAHRPGQPMVAHHDRAHDRVDDGGHGAVDDATGRRDPAEGRLRDSWAAAAGGLGGVDQQRHRVRVLVLAPRPRRAGSTGQGGGNARPGLPVPGGGPARPGRCRLVPAVRRLPGPVVQHEHGVQPDRCLGDPALVEDLADAGVGHLTGPGRPGRRPGHQHPVRCLDHSAGVRPG